MPNALWLMNNETLHLCKLIKQYNADIHYAAIVSPHIAAIIISNIIIQ